METVRKRLFYIAVAVILLTTKTSVLGNAVTGNIPRKPQFVLDNKGNDGEAKRTGKEGDSKVKGRTAGYKWKGREGHIA